MIPNEYFEQHTELAYDATNNLTSVKPRSGSETGYIWDADGNRVIAKIVGTNHANVFVESFESSGTIGDAKTGERYHNSGTFEISIPLFNPTITTNMVMTYWYWQDDEWKFSGEIPFNRNISHYL